MHYLQPLGSNSGIQTLDDLDRVPRILRLDVSGQPIEWLSWQDAVSLYARDLVIWTLGEPVLRIRGGRSRIDASRSEMALHSIIACDGRVVAPQRNIPPLTNRALFRRDQGLCLYCGKAFIEIRGFGKSSE